jgi:hypothetical protein
LRLPRRPIAALVRRSSSFLSQNLVLFPQRPLLYSKLLQGLVLTPSTSHLLLKLAESVATVEALVIHTIEQAIQSVSHRCDEVAVDAITLDNLGSPSRMVLVNI